jgi:hypothetical protein
VIALITPTGARPRQIQLCAKFMEAQTYKGDVTWVIVDDGNPRTTNFIPDNFRDNWTIIKIYPKPAWEIGQNTQGRNISAGMKVIKALNPELIFIIEDDDYYRHVYLEEMMKRKGSFDVIGERNTIYYNVASRRWCINGNEKWSSLFQTAFTMNAIPAFERLYTEKFIDFTFFKQIKNIHLFNAGNLSIGIKGQPGRAGIGAGHTWSSNMIKDPEMLKLKEFIGDDFRYYRDLSSL